MTRQPWPARASWGSHIRALSGNACSNSSVPRGRSPAGGASRYRFQPRMGNDVGLYHSPVVGVVGARRASQQHGECTVKLIGIILIVCGIAALAMGGFSYTKREKVLDIGPLQATTETRETIPIAPIAGVAALAGGIALLVVGSKTRA